MAKRLFYFALASVIATAPPSFALALGQDAPHTLPAGGVEPGLADSPAAALASGLDAQASLPANPTNTGPGDLVVTRPGDNEMTCAALQSEIDDLTRRLMAVQSQITGVMAELNQSAASSRSRVGGGAMGLAGVAASLIPGASMFVAPMIMAQQNAAMAAVGAEQKSAMDRATELAEAVTPMATRIQHLSEIASAHNC
ncbi:MAG: hypothetical protein EON90_06315 [Brevundimonas sp.]|nr:MAG: hypothetical protein EON90_06315 [Brevundimonas sp.]